MHTYIRMIIYDTAVTTFSSSVTTLVEASLSGSYRMCGTYLRYNSYAPAIIAPPPPF